jgi:hypothetical protein
MALAAGVWAGTWLVAGACSRAERYALFVSEVGDQMWILPVLPDLGWLVFLAVFAAVRLCDSRAGSRRECIAVGLSPLIPASLGYLLLVLPRFGLLGLAAAAGSMIGVAHGRLTLGGAAMVRTHSADLLGLAGTCLAATWLYFRVAGGRGRQPAAPESEAP